MMDKLISQQAAIEAVVGCTNCENEDVLRAYVTKHSLENGWTGGIVDALDAIEQLPSAQPETNCSEIPNNSDTISRQAVTKFLNDWLSCLFENCHKQSASDLKMIIKDFKNLPPAQTDIIFCKDCKHYREYSGVVDGCCNMAEWYRRYQYPEDFCSRAERREDG